MLKELSLRNQINKNIIRKFLLGPQNGPDEVFKNDSPLNFYITGVLYPRESDINIDASVEKAEEEKGIDKRVEEYVTETSSGEDGLSSDVDEMLMISDFKPSAIGISAIVKNKVSFLIDLDFGVYNKETDPEKQEEINVLKHESPELQDDDLPIKFCIFKRKPLSLIIEITVDGEALTVIKDAHTYTGRGRVSCPINNLGPNELWAQLNINRRKLPGTDDRCIITVTLTNELKLERKRLKNPQYCLFQPQIRLHSSEKSFYSGLDMTKLENRPSEIISLHLQYLKYGSFATGHGCATSWENSEKTNLPLDKWLEPKKYVQIEIIPSYEVAMSDVDFNDSDRFEGNRQILDMRRLLPQSYGGESDATLFLELTDFIKRYENWIKDQENLIDIYLESLGVIRGTINFLTLQKQAINNLTSCKSLLERMLKGISILEINQNARKAFRDANLAMYMQRSFSEYIKLQKKEFGDNLYSHFVSNNRWQDGYQIPTPNIQQLLDFEFVGKWRPFQLAFLLAQVEGTIDPSSEDRDTTDLIWFSTGGGKTEAYLGLIAFTIFYRRLTYPTEASGVTTIMRYTLRLLNKQQFSRAVPLICACELIRRSDLLDNLPVYGCERISIGIWVGSGLTPNKWENPQNGFWDKCSIQTNDLKNNRNDIRYTLPISECPCCGSRLLMDQNGNIGTRKGLNGIIAPMVFPNTGNPRYNEQGWLICTNPNCHFGIDNFIQGFYNSRAGETLLTKKQRILEMCENAKLKGFPIYFVDETIYAQQPTLLFSTVDKYASLNWKPEAFRLFNLSNSQQGDGMVYTSRPPELIIQDEMHLITSALGTIYGVFEIAVDELCSRNEGDNFVLKPKIVTATATARNAENQAGLLYGRKKFMQFPPPALDADDSFFSKKRPINYSIENETCDAFGRLYLGIMPSGATHTVNTIRLVSSLLQFIPTLETSNATLDNYYNVLSYYNSLKELGKFRTLLQDDIPAYRKVLGGWSGTVYQGYEEERFIELSSQLSGEQISSNLDHLEKVNLPSLPLQITDIQAQLLQILGIRKKSDIISGDNKFKDGFTEIINKLSNEEAIYFYNTFTGREWQDAMGDLRSELKTCILRGIDSQIDHPLCQVIAATNMISVGVDISRMNIMQITGQPKMHAEYIQASSRVGRIFPGIAITTYNTAKNRDRSHYERFTDYHRAFYKFVEATSVTPFSRPALEKVLPAVVYAIMRKKHFGNGSDAKIYDCDKFNTAMEEIFQMICSRIGTGNNEFISNFEIVFQPLKDEWNSLSQNMTNLYFPDYGSAYQQQWDDKLYLSPNKKLELVSNLDPQYLDDRKGVVNTLRNVEESTTVQTKKFN
jgi:hypothetical protein